MILIISFQADKKLRNMFFLYPIAQTVHRSVKLRKVRAVS